MPRISSIYKPFLKLPKLLWGDWLAIAASILVIGILFQTLWMAQPAGKLRIRVNDKVYGTYSLGQIRTIPISGHLGNAVIVIQNGRARFAHSPCRNQYCVHQGWLQRTGQVAICLPNRLSLELLGDQQPYDSLNY